MIEVLLVPLHQSVQVVLAQDQEVVEALPSQAAQETLADGVCLGCSIRCSQHLDPCAVSYLGKRIPILVVVVVDQKARSFCKGSRFAQLLGCPLVGWVPRHPKMDNSPRAQLDDDEHEDGAKEEIIGLKEIAGPNLAGVVAQERNPGHLSCTAKYRVVVLKEIRARYS